MIEYLDKAQMKALYRQLFPEGKEDECPMSWMKPMLACSLHKTERCVKISCDKSASLEEESIAIHQEAAAFLKKTDRKITTLHFLCGAETLEEVFNALSKGEKIVGLKNNQEYMWFESPGWPTMILLFEIEGNIWDDWDSMNLRIATDEDIKEIIGE